MTSWRVPLFGVVIPFLEKRIGLFMKDFDVPAIIDQSIDVVEISLLIDAQVSLLNEIKFWFLFLNAAMARDKRKRES